MSNRVLGAFEKRKRGCQYCLHITTLRYGGEIRNACPFESCKYDVLDKYQSYEEFMASEDSKIMVTEFFTTVASCYELSSSSQSPKRVYSDGDHKIQNF